MNKNRLSKQLSLDEGKRKRLYQDSVGKATIGVGRNIEDKGLRDDEIALMLSNDIDEAEAECRANCPWFNQLNDVRQEVLVNMCFNMGWPVLSQFRNTLDAVRRGDYEAAAKGMLASKWASQVKGRAIRLAEEMRTGIKK